jgi:hypothetical protein
LKALYDCDRVLAAPCFADDVESGADVDSIHIADDRWGRAEKLAQAGSKKTLVVGENDAEGRTC